MIDDLVELLRLLELYLKNALDMDLLDDHLTKILVSEYFDNIPDKVKDELYFLDMHDLELPTEQQIIKSISVIKTYLKV